MWLRSAMAMMFFEGNNWFSHKIKLNLSSTTKLGLITGQCMVLPCDIYLGLFVYAAVGGGLLKPHYGSLEAHQLHSCWIAFFHPKIFANSIRQPISPWTMLSTEDYPVGICVTHTHTLTHIHKHTHTLIYTFRWIAGDVLKHEIIANNLFKFCFSLFSPKQIKVTFHRFSIWFLSESVISQLNVPLKQIRDMANFASHQKFENHGNSVN